MVFYLYRIKLAKGELKLDESDATSRISRGNYSDESPLNSQTSTDDQFNIRYYYCN